MQKLVHKLIRNIIRIGKVSAIDEATGSVQIVFEDKDDMVTDYLPYLAFEYYMPNIGDLVLCVFLGNGLTTGFCLGKFFSDLHPAPVQNKDIYYKDLFGESFFKYDKSSKTLTLNAEKIVIEGDLTITGDITALGKITATGNITGALVFDGAGNVRS